jgi:DNA-binding GntR family transcriptional regulator
MDLQISRSALTLREQVEDKLRHAIADGVFKPGQRLVERELCELIGVGRTSVREAIRQLEAEGLVTTYPNRGPLVSTLSADDARHLYAVRALLEGYAGRMFAQTRTDAELDMLEAVYARFERAAGVSPPDRAFLLDSKADFYDVLLEGGRNPYAKQMLKTLHNRISLLRATSMMQPGRLKSSVREIRKIVDAIRSGDAAAAEAACVAHIEAAAQVALDALASVEQIGIGKRAS